MLISRRLTASATFSALLTPGLPPKGSDMLAERSTRMRMQVGLKRLTCAVYGMWNLRRLCRIRPARAGHSPHTTRIDDPPLVGTFQTLRFRRKGAGAGAGG